MARHRGAAVARGLPPAGGVEGEAASASAAAPPSPACDRHILDSSPEGPDLRPSRASELSALTFQVVHQSLVYSSMWRLPSG